MSRPRRTPEKDWADEFFAAFDALGTVKDACAFIGIGRSTVYDRRREDKAFAERWTEIDEDLTQRMEKEAIRRAVEGVRKPIYQGGKLVGFEQRMSDTLLIFMLKAKRPDVYRERIETFDGDAERDRKELENLPDEQLDRELAPVDQLAEKRKRRAA